METRFLDSRTRVAHGRQREAQIATALRNAGLSIADASDHEDKHEKIDRWVMYPNGQRVALQIKYRETGNDILVEVFDKFFGWDDPRNKIGRDMIGAASQYAVLLNDQTTIVIVESSQLKSLVEVMISGARQGWTVERYPVSTFRYFSHGVKLELKSQRDPRDGRQKMVAYIPANYFIAVNQAMSYTVTMPEVWKNVP